MLVKHEQIPKGNGVPERSISPASKRKRRSVQRVVTIRKAVSSDSGEEQPQGTSTPGRKIHHMNSGKQRHAGERPPGNRHSLSRVGQRSVAEGQTVATVNRKAGQRGGSAQVERDQGQIGSSTAVEIDESVVPQAGGFGSGQGGGNIRNPAGGDFDKRPEGPEEPEDGSKHLRIRHKNITRHGSPRPRDSEVPVDTREGTLKVHGQNVKILDVNSKSQDTILISPGYGQTSEQFRRPMGEIARAGHRLLTLDPPLTGSAHPYPSEYPRMEAWKADALTELVRYSGSNNITMFAVSEGLMYSAIAMKNALDKKEIQGGILIPILGYGMIKDNNLARVQINSARHLWQTGLEALLHPDRYIKDAPQVVRSYWDSSQANMAAYGNFLLNPIGTMKDFSDVHGFSVRDLLIELHEEKGVKMAPIIGEDDYVADSKRFLKQLESDSQLRACFEEVIVLPGGHVSLYPGLPEYLKAAVQVKNDLDEKYPPENT